MKQEYNPRNFLRVVPAELLRQYFDKQGALADFKWDALKGPDIDPLYEAWLATPPDQRKAMSAEFQRVLGLASRQGIQTILTVGQTMSARSGKDLAAVVKEGRSNVQKVFLVLLEAPEVFKISSRFAWADNLRRYWFHRRDLPAIDADTSEAAKLELKAAISDYYLKEQCRGEYCYVDHQVRGNLHYWMVYLADHPSAENCFEGSDELKYDLQQRAFDVVFVFDNKGGLNMYAEGGAELRRDLAVRFARHILRREVVLVAVVEPVFDLGVLKDPSFRFKIEPSDGITSMHLLSMKLMAPDATQDRIAFTTSARSHPTRLHGWIKRGLNARELPLASLKVEHVEIQAALDNGNTRSNRVRFSLTSSNACNLKDTPEHDRIKACLKRSEVMLTSPLDRLLKRIDVPDHRISNDEVYGWPKDDHKQICDLGLIQLVDDADSLACDVCGRSHDVEDVSGTPAIRCPRIGLVPVVRERLRRWQVDMDRLAFLCAASLQKQPTITAIKPGRLWLLGQKSIGGRTAEVFLAQGAHWSDGIRILRGAPRLRNSPAPIILVPDRLPDDPEWQHQGRALFSLTEIARLDDSGLVVRLEQAEDLYRQIAGRLEQPITPTPVEDRPKRIKDFQKGHNNCTLTKIHDWADVDRGDFHRWTNGHSRVPDGSEPADRIERLLQFGIKARE